MGRVIDATIRAEIKRMRKVNGTLDRRFLKAETGLTWNELEARISKNAVEMLAEESIVDKAQR
jgi:hypothetical protein